MKDASAPRRAPQTRIFALLAALVTAASLLPAPPTAARDGAADHRPLYSACVGPAAQPAGFADVPRVFQSAVDCLAHYRITLGRSPERFDPGDTVTRAQMARFLIRAALPAGIELLPAPDRGFADIGHLSAETVQAINQLAALDIARGRTPDSFAPGEPVTRGQMAQFLARFLQAAPVGPGGSDISRIQPDDEIFTDIGRLNRDAHNSVRRLYEMGVTAGTDYDKFSPEQPVTRGQMAAFITRALAHTQARPAGVTVQTESLAASAGDRVPVVASVRTDDFAPFQDRSVDIFTARTASLAIGRDGKCLSSIVTGHPVGSAACLIDEADDYTDRWGNLTFMLTLPNSLTMWAWAGDAGDAFDADTSDYGTLRFSADKGAAALRITDDLPDGALQVRYGGAVTFTFQAVDEDGTPVSRRGISFTLRIFANQSGTSSGGRSQTLTTDSSGRAVRTLRYSDPSASGNDFTKVTLEVANISATLGVDDQTTAGVVSSRRTVDWDDAPPAPTSLLLQQERSYVRATSSGSGAENNFTVALTDQYGSPIRGARVNLWSNLENGLGGSEADPAVSRNTNSRGTFPVSYDRDSGSGAVERIVARTADGRISKTARFYWGEEPDEATYQRAAILHKDDEDDVLVASTGGDDPEILLFDFGGDDHFFDAAGSPITFAQFRREIEEEDATEVTVRITGGSVDEFHLV